jgi:hypothetical protein
MMAKRTAQELDELADRFELDELEVVSVDNTEDLRAVAEAYERVAAAEARLREAVEVARAHGRSWSRVGVAMDMSRQGAQQRFGKQEG